MAKALIFDLDGTLLDTLTDLANSMNYALEQLGYPIHPVDEYKGFVGSGARNMVSAALPEDADEHTRDKAHAMFLTYYDKHDMDFTRPYEGIVPMLDRLTDMGISMSILSNKPNMPTNKIVEEIFPSYDFVNVYGERKGIARKPDPASAIQVAKNMGIPPQDILFIGDTGSDMQTAVNAGMVPVGVLWGFRTKEELLKSGARHLLAHPEELFDLLLHMMVQFG